MEITGEDYQVVGDLEAASVTFRGALRLRGMGEYAPIIELLDQLEATEPEAITLDMQGLRFLNSSGINVLFKFVLKANERGSSQIVVHGAEGVRWQRKSLPHLQRLMPTLQLVFE
jgi:hypothetical protein